MNRVCLLLVVALVLLSSARICVADTVALDVEKMKVALHTATPQEKGFIEYVVARVQAGTLPLDLVESTFLWARKKPTRKFYYFKFGLIERAAKRGIKL